MGSEADALLAAAKRKEAPKPWYNFFTNEKEEPEKASDLYTKAGNAYKYDQKWETARQCYLSAYQCDPTSISALISAARCAQRVDLASSIPILTEVINQYRGKGSFYQSAKFQQELAHILNSLGRYTEALTNYEIAKELYLGEDQFVQARYCLTQMGEIAIHIEDYRRAAIYYEEIAKICHERHSHMFTYTYLFNAGICQLYYLRDDPVALQRKLDEYYIIDEFRTKLEGQLLDGLFYCFKTGSSFFPMANSKQLSNWQLNLLRKLESEIDFT